MKKKTSARVISALFSASVLLSGPAVVAESNTETPLTVTAREKEYYQKFANIEGRFEYDQNGITPTDEIFNLFGTAVTGICAKPGFAMENDENAMADFYVNVGGALKKTYSVNVAYLAQQKSQTRMMMCSCAMGPALAGARVTGVPLEEIIDMTLLEEGVNTVTVKSADGYGLPIPLSVAISRGAMLVYEINGEKLPASQGAPLQLWMPMASARYFTRQVTDIELTVQDEEPVMEGVDGEYRAKVAILNKVENEAFHVGDEIEFEGYADDCGKAIVAVEFSMDGGETWTAMDTSKATPERWIIWRFGYTPTAAGEYQLTVRARCKDGTVSPLAAKLAFTVK